MFKTLKKLFDNEYKELYRFSKLADQIDALDEEMSKLSDKKLASYTDKFKKRLEEGETLDDILVEAFAVAREAAYRCLGMKPFYCQLLGGLAIHYGNIAEMKTGEGKTLTCVLPAYLNALTGKGVHIVTVNEFLSTRDSEWMGSIFKFLGLTVGLNLRELSFKDGKLLQKPLKEMQQLRKNEFHCALSEFVQWEPKDSCFELHIDFEERTEKNSSVKIQLREDVFLSWEKGLFRLNMGKSGHGRKERIAEIKQLRNLTIFSDTSAIEIFINDGENVMTTRVYSENLEQKVTFLSKGNVGNVAGYELGSFVIEKHEEK